MLSGFGHGTRTLRQTVISVFHRFQRRSFFEVPLSLLHRRSPLCHIKQVHARVVISGLLDASAVAGHLFVACALSPFSTPEYALDLFECIVQPDAFIRNTLIRGFAERGEPRRGIALYERFLAQGALPNNYTFPFALKACARAEAFYEGDQIHCHVWKLGFTDDIFVANALIHFYGCCRKMTDAQKVFDDSPQRDVVSWNSLLVGYVHCEQMNDARQIFDEIPDRDAVSWSTLASGYVQTGLLEEALALFEMIKGTGVPANEAMIVTALSASAQSCLLGKGRAIHSYVKSSGFPMSSTIVTALIDMYMRCGSTYNAYQVFDSNSQRNISTWNAMICGLAMNGEARASLDLFELLRSRGLQPVNVTFVGVLSACSHTGLVQEGRHYFRSMVADYGIEPEMEHYGCMVDLLGRAGLVLEAEALIKEIPGCTPDPVIWGMLLNACNIHGFADVGERIGKMLLNLEPVHHGNYVLLSGIYAKEQRWHNVLEVRELMKNRSTKKVPGWSLIETEGEVHTFLMADRQHPRSAEIHSMLNEIFVKLKDAGYVVDTSPVLHDIEEEEKELMIGEHSERLALAFGLIVVDPTSVIRIIKNLRVCWDCHVLMKMISKVFERELVVRDGSRFHHIKQGKCSCLDYW